MSSLQDDKVQKSVSEVDGKRVRPCITISSLVLGCLKFKAVYFVGSGSCPDCNVPLRRSNYRVQLFEDPMVEKEIDIRKRVLKDYNKKEEDFATLREYNDYLEEIETIIYNLMNNIDIVNTNKKIEQYKKDNKELIMKNKVKIGREEIELEEILEIEKQMEDLRRAEIMRMEQEAKKQKIREKEALIDELMFAEGDAKDILNTFAQTIANKQEEVLPPAPKFSTGVKFTRGLGHDSLPLIDEGPLYKYTAPTVPDRRIKNMKIHKNKAISTLAQRSEIRPPSALILTSYYGSDRAASPYTGCTLHDT
ncbi:CDK-activating kinase assembly factor MAT1 [Operophtera brumata]|uniref:CDK-activating kinase assembly factor MAT1 n=1 Tax=Operophtera brumata TaxID=104452 RepID=A0A0L7KPV0_OPEBR|nr:CDK-activating kinase assembly factor MAT1 [Operophtera brumata]